MAGVQPGRSGHLEVGAHRIWWEYFGAGEREAVCLLNGLAMHTKAWYGFLDQLRPDYDVILYDYLGQGETSCPDEPYLIPDFCHHLTGIVDLLGIDRFHLMGISYGGFVALDYGRLYQERLHTLTLSGILLSHERQFQMYQDLSLRFYRSGPEAFEIYTHYLYEKIFGEAFLRALPAETLETMRRRFHERYRDRVHSLIRLTEAQDPFFLRLDDRLDEYRAIRVPTLILAGGDDRAIPVRMQRPIAEVLPEVRFEVLEGSGHVVYLEKKDAFFRILKTFMATRDLDFALPEAAT
ncbi:MAG: alpha/beta hydrolase [bacterium]|nr:alpha/beta hydrolase [bacterium]